MKVLILRADSSGCAFYRAQEPARVVQEQFPDIEIRVDIGADVEAEQDRRTHHVTVHEVKEDIDLLILQRPLKQKLGALLEQARKQGIATIVELDDDFSTIHPDNRAYQYVQADRKPIENKEWLAKTAAGADLLTCTTEILQKYNPQYAVLPNYVPESIFDIQRPHRDRLVAGWTGTIQTHPHDLEVARGQIGKVLELTGSDLFVVGESKGVREALRLSPQTNLHESGWVALENYYQRIADSIDVGIVPLERSDFNRAKSWLKGLEFAALGIPFVASDTPDYRRLQEYGIGKTAVDHNQFRYALRSWLNDPDAARADGESYRAIVRDQFTYEQHAKDWVKAWERAIDIRKKASS